MDRIQRMEVFVRVAELGSFAKTADSMAMSRAAVSVAIRQLEAHVGARLLHRTTRRVQLTAEGIRFHERCLRVLAELGEAEELFRTTKTGATGTLSIDVPTRIARRVIIPALGEFLAQNPGLNVHLGASDRAVNLIERGVDAVIRVGSRRDSSLVARALGSLAQVNCASPSYLARHGQPVRLGDLDRHRIVDYSPNFSRTPEWDYLEDGRVRSRKVRSTVSVDNAETYIACCLAGLGLIQIPVYDVRHHLESGALVAVMPRYVPPALPIALVYPSRRQVPPRVQLFAAWATALFARHGMLSR
jgi:LysR family transcriptional regulator for bpeEF and oprC